MKDAQKKNYHELIKIVRHKGGKRIAFFLINGWNSLYKWLCVCAKRQGVIETNTLRGTKSILFRSLKNHEDVSRAKGALLVE